jgi:hypothetical protein
MNRMGQQQPHRRSNALKQPPMSYNLGVLQAKGRDGHRHPLFEARRDLVCVRCNNTIGTGERFTKQRHPTLTQKNTKTWPCCGTCYPFEEVPHLGMPY